MAKSSKSITHRAVFSKEVQDLWRICRRKETHKQNEGLEARKASRHGLEREKRWKELGDRQDRHRDVVWCGVTSNLVSFPIICMHLFDVNLLSTKRQGFASIQQVIPKSTLANPIAVRQEFPPVEGNFHFFLLRFDWRQWLTVQNHQDSSLGENIPGVCLGRCCWSLETCWRGRRWQDGKQHVKQMRSKKNLCRICNHLIPFVHIGDWQMNFRLGNTFFSSAAQDVRYYRRESAVLGWTNDGTVTVCSTEWHYPFAKRQPQDSRQCWWLSPQEDFGSLALFCSWVKFWKEQRIWMDWIAEVAEVEYLNQNQSN